MTSPLALPRLIGHRGARNSAPENTLAGIRQGHREGVTWVEFDVKLTSDSHAILMHDETLERTTDGRGPVRAATLADIRRLDAGSSFGPAWRGEKVPTLAETMALLAELDMGFNLEIKPCPGREAETARVALAEVAKHWPAGRPLPVISCFKTEALEVSREVAPDLPRGYLVEKLLPGWQADASRLGCRTVHVSWNKLTRLQVEAVKVAGYQLAVWTVNEPAKAREILSWGADSIITDCPAMLAAAL
jgi:glycerophosphoryl diester phosphodiesterase